MPTLFQKAADRPVSDSLTGMVWGLPKSGKTTFCIGNEEAGVSPWPLPIFYFNYDNMLDGLLPRTSQKVRDNLYVVDLVDTDINLTLARAKSQLQKAEDALREATSEIRKEGGGTIVVDTMTHHWALVRAVDYDPVIDAKQQAGKTTMQTDYGAANARHRNFVNALRAAGGNVLFLAHAKPYYIGKDRTDLFEPAAQRELDGLVHFRLRTYSAEIQDKYGKRTGTEHGGEVEYCNPNDDVSGVKLPGLDYPMLYTLVYGSEPKERF